MGRSGLSPRSCSRCTPGANHGFRIRDATENGAGFEQVFNSRETSQNQPQLVITFG